MIKKALGVVTLSLLMISVASAETYNGLDSNSGSMNKDTDSYVYFGLKGGLSMVDENSTKNIDNPVIYGGYAGYQFNDRFGMEVDYTISGETDVTTKHGTDGQYELTSYGTYATYLHTFNNSDLYAKAKLGVGGAEIDVKYNDDIKSTDDVGIVGGLGLGYRTSPNISLEGEFNMLRSDTIDTNAVTLGVKFQF